MENAILLLEEVMHHVVIFAKLLFEFVGIGVVVWTGIKSLVKYLRKDHDTGLYLSNGLCMSLSFLMIGEILRTIIAPDLKEIAVIGGIIVLRVALSVMLHWEMHEEEKAEDRKEAKEHHS